MRYSLLILPRAVKELSVLEATEYQKIKKAILRLADNPRPSGCSKLTGREGWRIELVTIGSSMKSTILQKRLLSYT
jgi:mRNA interferase RelE/StbE